jgi:LPS-assembly protein
MLLSAVLLFAASLTVQPQDSAETMAEGDVVVTAERISRQSENGPIVAEGGVRASSGSQFLKADRVVYDPLTETITAYGNVAVKDEDGNLYFAEEAVLSSDLENAFIEVFASEVGTNGNLAAASAIQRESGKNELRKSVFTLCPVCDQGLRRDRPLWQLKANRVVQDEEDKVLRFRNALVEVFGIPTFYIPYLQVPDPSLDRASGFLALEIANSDRTGVETELPYYWAISNYQDLTFAPRHYSNLGTLLKGEWRRNTYESRAVVQAGFINPTNDLSQEPGQPEETRWHWFSNYQRGDLPFGFSMEADIDAVSDKGYLLTYDIRPVGQLLDNVTLLSPDRLQSSIDFRRDTATSSTDITGILFQTLRFNEDQAFTANALPRLRHRQEFDLWGGELEVEGHFLALDREEGLDSMRAVAQMRYNRVRITDSGHRFEFFGELRGDGYRYDQFNRGVQQCNVEDRFYERCREAFPKDLEGESFTTTRFLPTIGAEWSYPIARIRENTSFVIEPRVQLVASPNRDFSEEVLNEDSQFFQFDTVTLFDWNKSSGLDLWEDGQRLNVGLATTAVLGEALTVNSSFGLQYRAQETRSFLEGNGLGETRSDFVGAVDVRLGRRLIIDNRFRIDDESGEFRRLESSVSSRIGPLRGRLNYLRVQGEEFNNVQPLDEFLVLSTSLKLNRNISIGATQAQNLDSGNTTRTSVALRVANQCLGVSVRYLFNDSSLGGFEQNRAFLVKFDVLGF